MSISNFGNVLTGALSRVKFKFDQHSPEILLATGIASGVAAAVSACRSTLKVDEVLEPCSDKVRKIHEARDGVLTTTQPYTNEDASKDLVKVYAKTGLKLAKLYAPSIVLGGVSVACLIGSHNILSRRNAGLAAAYAGLDAAYKQYRKNVVDIFGEEADTQAKYGLKAEEVTEEYQDEKGKTKTRETTKLVRANDPALSPFAIFFDETCDAWTKDPELNKKFLLTLTSYLNERLDLCGHVYWNDVRRELNMKDTADGGIYGWVKDSPDVRVDLGLDNVHKVGVRDFMNGWESSVILEPVGIKLIWDKVNDYSWV